MVSFSLSLPKGVECYLYLACGGTFGPGHAVIRGNDFADGIAGATML